MQFGRRLAHSDTMRLPPLDLFEPDELASLELVADEVDGRAARERGEVRVGGVLLQLGERLLVLRRDLGVRRLRGRMLHLDHVALLGNGAWHRLSGVAHANLRVLHGIVEERLRLHAARISPER